MSGIKVASGRQAPRVLLRTSVAEQVYEDIKERIIDQSLLPGARLNIDALARELSVSSTPIREALARLEREQLVSLELYAGYSVAPPPRSDYLEGLLDFRILWEGHCASVGAPLRRPETLRMLEQCFKKMRSTRRLGIRYREDPKVYRRGCAIPSNNNRQRRQSCDVKDLCQSPYHPAAVTTLPHPFCYWCAIFRST